MHAGNVMWDEKTKTLSVIDLGLVRLDYRSALIEALGTRKGRVDSFGGKVLEAGDYQSKQLFQTLNPKGQTTKNSAVWKQFEKNRKKVKQLIADDGLGDAFDNASIRKLPREISSKMSQDKAQQLLKLLYEGI